MIDIANLRHRYAHGARPEQVVSELRDAITGDASLHAWIHLLDAAALAPHFERLRTLDARTAPLWGIPFAIKDNVDLAGVPTTAGCPDFAYVPARSATAVERLLAAGAIPLGKTNLDQFATGLTGARSPYGVCRNAWQPEFCSGGSSSGSAVAVARGHVAFALGTDTAGSGRVPAGLNGLFGVKPTRGRVSTRGVVPACRSLDCVSVFAGTCADAASVLGVLAAYDAEDAWSLAAPLQALPRLAAPVIAVPQSLRFFDDRYDERLFATATDRLLQAGARLRPIDMEPFLAAGRLLYEGPWIAERWAALGEFIDAHPDSLHAVTERVLRSGGGVRGADVFRGLDALRSLARQCQAALAGADALLVPTTGAAPTLAEVAAEPLLRNSELGYYTNFANLLDLCALAVPVTRAACGVPFGVTLLAPAGADERLLALAPLLADPAVATADRAVGPVSVDDGHMLLAVCGAHMSGLPLNAELTRLGATLAARTTTAPDYRLYALSGFSPPRPGLVRAPSGGGAIEVETWSLPTARFGDFIARVGAPLCIGNVVLADGTTVKGFLCEAHAVASATDITQLGGWRAFVAR